MSTYSHIIIKGAGQFSEDALFIAEQFSIGGAGSIRGYSPSSQSGDSGYNLTAELQLSPTSHRKPKAGRHHKICHIHRPRRGVQKQKTTRRSQRRLLDRHRRRHKALLRKHLLGQIGLCSPLCKLGDKRKELGDIFAGGGELLTVSGQQSAFSRKLNSSSGHLCPPVICR